MPKAYVGKSGDWQELNPTSVRTTNSIGLSEDTCSVVVDGIVRRRKFRGAFIRVNYPNTAATFPLRGREVDEVSGDENFPSGYQTTLTGKRSVDQVAAYELLSKQIADDLPQVPRDFLPIELVEEVLGKSYATLLVNDEASSENYLSIRSLLEQAGLISTPGYKIVPMNSVTDRFDYHSLKVTNRPVVKVTSDELHPIELHPLFGDVIVSVPYFTDTWDSEKLSIDTKIAVGELGDGPDPIQQPRTGIEVVVGRNTSREFSSRALAYIEYERLLQKSATMGFDCADGFGVRPRQFLDMIKVPHVAGEFPWWRVKSVTHQWVSGRSDWTTSVLSTPARISLR